MREVSNERAISIPEVKAILEKIIAMEKIDMKPDVIAPTATEVGDAPAAGAEALEGDKTRRYFLKSTYDYVQTFAKIDARVARNLVDKLVAESGIPLPIAIQIANVNPDTQEELSLIMEKAPRRPSSEEIEKLLFKIREYKEIP